MIRLTKQTDYALVLLTLMAREGSDERFSASDLAERAKLPGPMVGKILKALAREGVLRSHRGVNGGYGLARPADEITVAEVITLFEGPIAFTECGEDGGACECELLGACPNSGNWGLISQAVARALEGLTLERMSQPLTRLPSATAEAATGSTT